MNIFTRRELIVIAFVIFFLILMLGYSSLISGINEYVYLIFVVIPLGILLITDKERLARLQQQEPPNSREEIP
jgi:hypothetical protein